jgi:hypothetical protein
MSVEHWVQTLQQLESNLELNKPIVGRIPLDKLVIYYDHLQGNMSSHGIDPQILEKQLQVVQFWQKDVADLKELIRQ